MAGIAVTPPSPAPGDALNSGGARNNGLNSSEVNSFGISAVIDCLSDHLGRHVSHDLLKFRNLCFTLASGIDVAIANNEVPGRFQDLPPLIRQVCESRNEPLQQAAIMVLMFSVKNACQSGWFSETDSEDLRKLTMEIASNFGSMSNLNTEPSCSHPVVSTIISRYLPRMKMGHIFAFLEVKPGFEAYVSDFQISKNLKQSPGEKIRLFVVQTDNIQTSSCLVTPPKVNFLLNGKGVEKRTNAYMDPAPQVPTIVMSLLKYGSNLLQAVGEFNGNYIIAVAFMNEMPIPDKNALQDYEQQAPATVDPDSEIIEGPSRISLNCPLSFKRIKTPVKGHSCKHIQCVDFDNYMDMNSRRPHWRCPHCNQHVCFSDIRIDRQMVNVLEEVGPDVSDIIFSSDGSWKAVIASSDGTQKPGDKVSEPCQDKSPQTDDILDLTLTDDAMDIVSTHEAVHTKLNPNSHQSSNSRDEDTWAAILMSTFDTPNVRANTQIVSPTTSFSSPNGEVEAFHSTFPQNETSLLNALILQQYQFGNPPVTNEYGRFPNFPRNVTRTPTAVQALPVQFPTSVPQQSFRNSGDNFIPIGIPASQTSSTAPNISTSATSVNNFGPNGVSSTAAPHIANSLPRVNPRPVPTSHMSSSPLYQNLGVQHQNRPFTPIQLPQQNAGLRAPNQVSNSAKVPSSSHQTTNHWVPRVSTVPAQSSGNFSRPQNHVGTSQNRTAPGIPVSSSQGAHLIAAANRAIQMAVYSPRTAPPSYSMNPGEQQRGNDGIAMSPPVMTDGYDPSDVNWRPAARMRGALAGQAYADALNQFIIRPNQQAQAARPQLQALVADRVSPGSPVTPNYPSVGPASRSGGTEFLPDGSSRQQ